MATISDGGQGDSIRVGITTSPRSFKAAVIARLPSLVRESMGTFGDHRIVGKALRVGNTLLSTTKHIIYMSIRHRCNPKLEHSHQVRPDPAVGRMVRRVAWKGEGPRGATIAEELHPGVSVFNQWVGLCKEEGTPIRVIGLT